MTLNGQIECVLNLRFSNFAALIPRRVLFFSLGVCIGACRQGNRKHLIQSILGLQWSTRIGGHNHAFTLRAINNSVSVSFCQLQSTVLSEFDSL